MTVGNDRSALQFAFTLLEAPVSTFYRFKEDYFLEGSFSCLTLEDSCFRKRSQIHIVVTNFEEAPEPQALVGATVCSLGCTGLGSCFNFLFQIDTGRM